MKTIHNYLGISIVFILLTLVNGFPLWAHHGANATKKLFLEEAKISLKAEDFSTVNLNNKPVKLSDWRNSSGASP